VSAPPGLPRLGPCRDHSTPVDTSPAQLSGPAEAGIPFVTLRPGPEFLSAYRNSVGNAEFFSLCFAELL